MCPAYYRVPRCLKKDLLYSTDSQWDPGAILSSKLRSRKKRQVTLYLGFGTFKFEGEVTDDDRQNGLYGAVDTSASTRVH